MKQRSGEDGTARKIGREGRRLVAFIIMSVVIFSTAGPARAADDSLSLRFDRSAVADLLPLIASHFGLDLFTAGEPPGILSISLEDRTLDSVMDEILLGTGYTWQIAGKTLRILPDDLIVSRTYNLDHITVEEIRENAMNILGDADFASSPSSNSITIVGSAANIRNFTDMIREMDIAPRQVDIRARMIEVNVTDLQTLGVNWLFQWDDQFQSVQATGTVNDPVPPSLKILYSRLTNFQADAVVDAILSNTESKVISAPRIASANNQVAKILVGERLPYTRFSSESATGAVQEEVDFVDVGIKLEVTPIISADSMVVMIVNVEISEVLDKEVQGIPRIGTREAHTRVAARSGETIVIGGLRKNQKIENSTGIPFLSRIPLLGRLFRYESVEEKDMEILIFLTPSVVGPGGSVIGWTGRVIEESDLGDEAF